MSKVSKYQKECLEALVKIRAEGKKKALVATTSEPIKISIAVFDVKEFLKGNPDTRVLVLCHSTDALSRIKSAFKRKFGDWYSYGVYNNNKYRRTDFLFADLEFLSRKESDPDEFSYIVVDEMYYLQVAIYRGMIDYFKPRFLLGLTATPEWVDDPFEETVYIYHRYMYTDEELIKILKAKAKQLGRTPTKKDVKNPKTFADRFGSWNKALEMAGFAPNRYFGFTDDEFIQLLKVKAERLGRVPTVDDVKSDDDMPSYATYINRFGSWNKALRAAGLSVNVSHTNEELIDLLKAKAESLGRTPTEIDIASDSSMPSAFTYRCRFKSWNKALEKAGLLPNRFFITDEELIDLLKKKANCLGRAPMIMDVNSDCTMPSVKSYRNRFGSWNKALKVAGLLPNRFHTTDEELIDLLKAKAESLGRTPNQRDVKYDHAMPSLSTYVNKFGSWNRALEAAGFTPNRVRRK